MSATVPQASQTIDAGFADKLIRCFHNPAEHGVHLLFNDW